MKMAQIQNHPEDVGKILVKVHEDLRQLKEQVDLFKISGKDIDAKAIDEALKRTEIGLQKNANFVFNMVNNRVQTLPAIDDTKSSGAYLNNAVERIGNTTVTKPIGSIQKMSPGEKIARKRRTDEHQIYIGEDDQVHEDLTMKALFDPENFNNRSVLNKSYGLVLPKIKQSKRNNKVSGQIVSAPIVEHLSVLPAANRRDPSLPPPPIDEKDARKGILSLIERGLIPPSAELTLDPSPVHLRRATLHDYTNSTRKDLYSDAGSVGEDSYFMATAKFDITAATGGRLLPVPSTSTSHMISIQPQQSRDSSAFPDPRDLHHRQPVTSAIRRRPKQELQLKVYDLPLQVKAQPTEVFDDEDEMQAVALLPKHPKSTHENFMIENYRFPDDAANFIKFKQLNLLHWGAIQSTVERLIGLLANYAIPRALVNKPRLVALASQYELEYYPDKYEMLSLLDNIDEVAAAINTPGRRYMAQDGLEVAATKIQSLWRYYVARKAYRRYRRQRWASALIALAWIMSNRKVKSREKFRESKINRLNNYRLRRQQLAANWETTQNTRRIILHVPSLGYSVEDRNKVEHFNQVQNAQLGRIFQLLDPNVSIIYVTPVDLEPDLTTYYKKLLGLRGAVESGSPETIEDFSKRVTIIHPENTRTFKAHSMSLATLLLYSPDALNRIKQLIGGRVCYYLPGLLNHEDLAVADHLNLPILGAEPEIVRLYSSKSGSKRIFEAAKVDVPPGEFDIYTAQQLNELLARLICDNPHIKKWILKIDSTFDGRGIAFIDVERNLPCYGNMMKQVKKFGDKWRHRWAQEEVFSQILYQLPTVLDNFASPADRKVYPKWINFLDGYLSKGGIIEAYPSAAVTCLQIDMLIEPNGKIEMKSCGDQIHAESPLKSFATTVPQSSVEPHIMSNLCKKISIACRTRGIIGYFSIDFVTFIDEDTLEQKIWATDLTIAYSDQMAMTETMSFLTNGKLRASESNFTIPNYLPEEKKFNKRKEGEEVVEEKHEDSLIRFAMMSTKLFHTNLIVVHHNVFFQMCRAHGIGYDIRERTGTLFFLPDPKKRERLGMLLIGEDLKETMESFATNLSVIHQEISTPNMQGESNFKDAIKDIDTIIKTFGNEEEEDDDDEC